MDLTSGISAGLYLGANALQVHSIGMMVEAHNMANVNTAAFEPQRALLATGPGGIGVQLDAVIRERPFGSAARSSAGLENPGGEGMPPEFLAPSGTEIAKEFPRMISTQHAFEANTKTAQTADEMMGSLLNIIA